ncbi:CsbD family protein [Streptomyces sp. XD-27]|uniref:CsbD family protein n=1 Tax=Streptomyces sp. XD-27 TaxID=3062779 RepID=UPI0026F42722|nr:CsbD family protein [Streptomyces sp. XD-27]WKX73582.1 CsbD family protein [Streptomyces sp. XD-27]
MAKGKAKAKQAKGKIKETLGKATGDRSLQAEGQGEQLTGKAREAAEEAAEKARKRTGR